MPRKAPRSRHSNYTSPTDMTKNVFLYIPNIIGYIRLLLLFVAYFYFERWQTMFIIIYTISMILDGVDGYAARKLNQVSAFGAWFDVVIDNIGRAMIWSRLFHWGWFVPCIEWCVFACTHSQYGGDWKTRFENAPFLVRKVMANGFKSPLGILVILGIHVLPVWMYGHYTKVLWVTFKVPLLLQFLVIAVLSAGRAVGMAVECWVIWTYVKALAKEVGNEREETS
ncbi:uncharacterized protein [Ptychodera flava]|uniref:uncharacterized protein n=1 Tax=Ptychodera flava TaxID=63121 RepID=UPI003969C579